MSSPFALHQIQFTLSAANISQLPSDTGHEVVIVGRSNAGKSSFLNCVTGHKKLARVSQIPGRTQLMNVYSITSTQRIIDLPGYGYAKASYGKKAEWDVVLGLYFSTRKCLSGIFLIMDCRHPFKPLDWQMIELALNRALPVHIILTKIDKITKSEQIQLSKDIKQSITHKNISWQFFSSLKKIGVDEATYKFYEFLTII